MSSHHEMSDIEEQSRKLAQMFGWVFWLTALWLFGSVSFNPLKRFGTALASPDGDALHAAIAFGEVLTEQLPVILAMGAVYTARGLFVQFSRGEMFTPANGASLTKVGDWLAASAITAFSMTVIFADNDAVPIDWSAAYSSVVMALIGLAVRLFGRTFMVAADIKADNDQMV